MVAPPLVSLRTATVAPEPVPTSRPMLYGVVLVQVTWIVELWSMFAASTPMLLPKFNVEALLIVQVATTVAETVKFVVAVPACEAPAQGKRKQAASAALYPRGALALQSMQHPHRNLVR